VRAGGDFLKAISAGPSGLVSKALDDGLGDPCRRTASAVAMSAKLAAVSMFVLVKSASDGPGMAGNEGPPENNG
jgi:hypothetical protein